MDYQNFVPTPPSPPPPPHYGSVERQMIDDGVKRTPLGVKVTTYEVVTGICMLFGYMYLIPIAVMIPFGILNIEISSIMLQLISSLVCLLIVVGVFTPNFLLNSFKDMRKYKLFRPGWFFACWGLGYAGNYVVNMILLLTRQSNQSENNQAISSMLNESPLAMAFTVIILAPIVEELIFRAAIFGKIFEKSPIAAHIINILLFSFVHVVGTIITEGNLSELPMMLSYVPLSFVLAFVYQKTKSIYPAIVLHMCVNGVAVALMLVYSSLFDYFGEYLDQYGTIIRLVTGG